MGKVLADPEKKRVRHVEIGLVLTFCCEGNTDFRVGYVSGNPPHWKGAGGVPPSGFKVGNMRAPTATRLWELAVTPIGRINAGSGLGVYGNLHLQET